MRQFRAIHTLRKLPLIRRAAAPVTTVLLASLVCAPAHASWWDIFFGSTPQQDNGSAASSDPDAPESAPTTPHASAPTTNIQAELSGDAITTALRSALLQGVQTAVARLGAENGFWANPDARIPLPEGMRGSAALIRQAGGGAAVDQFQQTLNRAAERAVPEAAEVFGSTVRSMTLLEVRDILSGPSDAATRFFQDRTEGELARRFRPIVAQSIDEVGTGAAYQAMVQRAGPYAALLGAPEDLPGYITEYALVALFDEVAIEEARIRANPAARGSEILQQVFGSGNY